MVRGLQSEVKPSLLRPKRASTRRISDLPAKKSGAETGSVFTETRPGAINFRHIGPPQIWLPDLMHLCACKESLEVAVLF